MYHTTRGLILREAKYKESDKILTILTETEGKITAKARGVARTRSKLAAATQLLCFSELTLFGHKGYWTINEAVTVEQFRGLRGDIELLALGSYYCGAAGGRLGRGLPGAGDTPARAQRPVRPRLGHVPARAGEGGVRAAADVPLGLPAGAGGLRQVRQGRHRERLSRPRPRRAVLRGLPETGRPACGQGRHRGHALHRGRRAQAHLLPSGSTTRRIRRLGQVCEAYALYELDRGFASLDYYKKVRNSK